MKLNLLIASDDTLAGYVNIDAVVHSDNKERGDILELDWIAQENSCQEIRAVDIIDYVDISQKENVLKHWVSRLKKGGLITLGGFDLYLTARAIHKHELSFQDASNILYGVAGPSISKSGLLALAPLKEFLKALGVQITSTKLDNNRYIVKGIKN